MSVKVKGSVGTSEHSFYYFINYSIKNTHYYSSESHPPKITIKHNNMYISNSEMDKEKSIFTKRGKRGNLVYQSGNFVLMKFNKWFQFKGN